MDVDPNKYLIYKVGDNAFLLWSTVVDAPVGCVVDRHELLGAGAKPDRVMRAIQFGHTMRGVEPITDPTRLVSGNRAGPNEVSLTLEALLRRYGSDEAFAEFVLRPEDIEPLEDDEVLC